MVITLDMYQTMAVAVAVFYLGSLLVRRIPILQKYCIPAPVVGGLIFALVNSLMYVMGVWEYRADATMQRFFMTLFFTSVGYTASFQLLKRGGVMVFRMLILASVLVVLQDGIGVALAKAIGIDPLIGMATASIPMIGGHGTAGSFGPVLEHLGVANGTTIAVAAATFGLVAGGLMGGPVAESLINRFQLAAPGAANNSPDSVAANEDEGMVKANEHDHIIDSRRFMHAIGHLLIAMGLGTIVSGWFVKMGVVFPSYIGAMLVAAALRNIADFTDAYVITQKEADVLGGIGLNIFLAMALMDLKLWQLLELAGPLFILLGGQIILMFIYTYFVIFRTMGKNYEAAVMASGCCGFGMGATPNAIANMNAVAGRFGPAPTAFFVIPLIGSLFIDFVNATIITMFLNFLLRL